jgi:hypothetical protein
VLFDPDFTTVRGISKLVTRVVQQTTGFAQKSA